MKKPWWVLPAVILAIALVASLFLLSPSFEINSLEIIPTEAGPGESVTVSVFVRNRGLLSGVYPVELWIDNQLFETRTIEVAGGELRCESFMITKEFPGIYHIRIGDLSGELKILRPPKFEITELKIDPQEVIAGENVKVTATVKNLGEMEGTYLATLFIDGVVFESTPIIVPGGSTEKITFTFAKDPGTYLIEIAGFTATVKVKPAVVVIQEETEPTSAENIQLRFEWKYGIWELKWEFSVSKDLYDYYKNKPRPPTGNYSVYVTDPRDDNFLEELVMKFGEVAAKYNFTETEKINCMIAFVQSLPYTPDEISTPYDEYPRYPLETLVDGGGDCEDSSILLAALLDGMGYDVILIELSNHMGVGISGNFAGFYYELEEKKYFYIETTSTGWRIGELPSEFSVAVATLYPIMPIPVLTHSWKAEHIGYQTLELLVTVKNEGTATAENIYVYAGFDAGENMMWNPQKSENFSLPADSKAQVTLRLTLPKDKYTRLIVQVIMENYVADQSFSSWFKT
ncbi:MAG: CARDB domain-containing protein [Candidatus Hadarchaeaceae archaeon]